MKYIALIATLLYCYVATLTLTSAQTPTVKSTLTPTPTSTASSEDIKEKVQARIEEINDKAKKRAFWGTLKEINGTTLVISGPRGEKRIKTDDTTKFVDSAKKEIKITDLEIGNFVISLGFWKENGTLEGKRVLVLKTAPKPAIKRNALSGKVNEIVKEEKVLSLTSGKDNQNTLEVQFNSKTVITKKVDGKIKKVLFSAITVGDRIVIVATKETDNNGFTAKIAHIIPGLATGQNKVTPTPSTKLTPTPTKKLTPTPTKTPSE